MNKRRNIFNTMIGLFIISVIYIIMVKTIDVQPIGPNGTSVGFAGINNFIHKQLGLNMGWYKLSKYLGIITFFIIFYYAYLGLKQLIARKKLFKVDRRLLILGCFYILVGLVYILFEKVIINYRPVILKGELEASFPSSHTMLGLCVCMSSLFISKYYVKDKKYLKYFNIGTIAVMILLVISRTLSGVHWFTDIIGGIIISIFLISIFYLFIYTPRSRKNS